MTGTAKKWFPNCHWLQLQYMPLYDNFMADQYGILTMVNCSKKFWYLTSVKCWVSWNEFHVRKLLFITLCAVPIPHASPNICCRPDGAVLKTAVKAMNECPSWNAHRCCWRLWKIQDGQEQRQMRTKEGGERLWEETVKGSEKIQRVSTRKNPKGTYKHVDTQQQNQDSRWNSTTGVS